ncbi:MAG TPA: phosphatase PAP2 family protein [Tepidisphaeraceae bacterium]|nr:phosphatase PAP2 family protein [Tepidisphaeraceae bacterium]
MTLLSILLVGTAAMMLIERLGAPVTLQLSFKGDLKRESRWFAQYGQGACMIVISLLLWRLDERKLPSGLDIFVPLVVAVVATGLLAVVVKRLCGRIRPGRENAGRFLGPTWRHASYRESFPSSHTASAVATSVVLAHLYPQATPIFLVLAIICAVLRYLMDAHWPSDVLAGFALGYAVALATLNLMGA